VKVSCPALSYCSLAVQPSRMTMRTARACIIWDKSRS
jgi:hypothetical protein